jgi:hypothetical protein
MHAVLHDRPRAASAALTVLNICAWAYAVAHAVLDVV